MGQSPFSWSRPTSLRPKRCTPTHIDYHCFKLCRLTHFLPRLILSLFLIVHLMHPPLSLAEAAEPSKEKGHGEQWRHCFEKDGENGCFWRTRRQMNCINIYLLLFGADLGAILSPRSRRCVYFRRGKVEDSLPLKNGCRWWSSFWRRECV